MKLIIITNYETKKFRNIYPGTQGRLEGKYYKNQVVLRLIVLQPHPQYGGTMNNRIVQLMYNIFKNGFSVIKINFRGVGKSEGVFIMDKANDAAAAQLD